MTGFGLDLKEQSSQFSAGSKPGQIAEVIAVLVSPEPLPGVKTGPEASRGALKLSEQQVAEWESKWDGQAERFELEEGR